MKKYFPKLDTNYKALGPRSIRIPSSSAMEETHQEHRNQMLRPDEEQRASKAKGSEQQVSREWSRTPRHPRNRGRFTQQKHLFFSVYFLLILISFNTHTKKEPKEK